MSRGAPAQLAMRHDEAGQRPATGDRRLPVVDGLRAFAIVAVVLFHGFPAIVGGGYIGVDIFFVISGFVITLRYLEPMVAREIGFRTFFLRRVRRLVPAYFAMLVATTLTAAWLMVPRDLINFGTSLMGQALYVQNIVFWLQGDYFDAALLKPLLHTWSLAIEEQFYLCFPLLVVALRWRPRITVAACLMLAVAGIGIGAAVEQISPKTSFYWLPFRAWEFLAGMGMAMLFRRGVAERVPAPLANAIGAAAMAGLVAAALLFDEDSAGILTQGLLAAAATAALCLIQERLSAGTPAIFTNRLAQHLGRISYSWYLWHWPPLVFAFILLKRAAAGWEALGLTALGYALGWISWRLLERDGGRSALPAGTRRTIALLIAFLTFGAVAGAALVASDGFVQRYPVAARPLLRAQMDRPDGRCAFVTRLRQWRAQTCPVAGLEGPGGILFIGDSHVEMQKPALAALGRRYGVPVYITKQNCRIVDFGVDRNCGWKVWRGVARDIRKRGITRVVAIALWPNEFDRAAFDAAVFRLRETGAQIVLERPSPQDAALAPAAYLAWPGAWGDFSAYTRVAHEERQRAVNEAISAWTARDRRMKVLDPTPLLCPGDRCLFARDGKPLYSDTHHLTTVGVQLIEPIYDPLFAAARQERAGRAAGPASQPE